MKNHENWTLSHIMLFSPYIVQHFMLMLDNTRAHAPRVVRDYLLEVGIESITWPARSPDLKPIEYV